MRAARSFGAAEQLRDVIDAPHAVVENQRYAEAVALARAALDPVMFDGAWKSGRKMAIEEAIAYALSNNQS